MSIILSTCTCNLHVTALTDDSYFDLTLGIAVLQLAQQNTPIHPWNIPNLPKEFSLFIKRDDLTGSTLSGNKVQSSAFVWLLVKIVCEIHQSLPLVVIFDTTLNTLSLGAFCSSLNE